MNSLASALQAIVRHNGPRIGMIDHDGPDASTVALTWSEFLGRVRRVAGALRGRGIGPGDRFGVFARNSRRFEELKWAGCWAASVPVPINWRLAPPEIRHILEDAECRVVFVDREFAKVFADVALAPWRERLVEIPDAYEALIAQAAAIDTPPIDADDDAIILYTGGTTGRSKGVRLSHRNILSNAVAFGLGVGARRDDRFLHVAPMFHSADLLATGWALLGATQVFLPAFTPRDFASIVRRERVTATVTVPTMLMATVGDPAFDAQAFGSLRVLIYGAAPMATEWVKRVAGAFPHADFLNCYGLTETAPDLTIFDPRELRAAIASDAPCLRSVGKPNVLNELRVVDRDGHDVAPGEAGELWARGPNITRGYLNLPAETSAALAGGWLHTGDIARIDAEGYVYLLDRLKDLVISGGENIYTSEIEAVLHQHPAILEAAVIGVPDERMGEALIAVVQRRAGTTLGADELIGHCRGKIGGYKIPRRIEFVEALPRNAMGKILKSELRKSFGATH